VTDPKRAFVITGATSETGHRTVTRLAHRVGADNITCIVRRTSSVAALRAAGIRLHIGDVTDPTSLRPVLGPNVNYIDMTHPKFYHMSLEALLQTGVKRAYFVTTTGIFSRYNQFAQIYLDNEARIRDSGVTYTILRPSMIYGTPRDKNMNRLVRLVSRSPFVPVVGAGSALMQPVYVDDLAEGIVASVGSLRAENTDYNLAGPRGLPFRQIIRIIASQLGRRVHLANVDRRLAARVAHWAQFVPGFPVTEEQVLRLVEDKSVDISKARADLKYDPRPFSKGIALEIAAMRGAGMLRKSRVSRSDGTGDHGAE
jgi:nucleoside-diphosphate-sugar epimerase